MSRDISQFNKNKKLDRIRRIKIFWIGLPVLLLVGIGFLALMRQPRFFIESITIEGTRSLDRELVFTQSRDYLNSSWAGLMPRKNILFFSKVRFKEWMVEAFPTVEHVDISFHNKKSITLDIHEKDPFAVWCQEETCFFMDEEGKMYSEAPRFSDGVFLMISGDTLENPLGNYFTEPDQIAEVKTLIKVLEEVPMHILTIELSLETHVRIDKIGDISVNSNAKLMIARDYDQGVLQEVLTLLLADPVFAQSLRDKGSSFEYLDLRTPGKMYYKFLN